MGSRLWFLVITTFWLAMMVLLWRAEYGSRKELGSPVPAAVIWQKILTAPDPSPLDIKQGTNRIGFCRWSATIGEGGNRSRLADAEMPLEGFIRNPTGYTLDLDGHLALGDLANRIRFASSLRFATNAAWQEFNLRIMMRPETYEVHARAEEQAVRLSIDSGNGKSTQIYRFADLQNPQRLLGPLVGLTLPGLMGGLPVPPGTNQVREWSLGLRWEGRTDWLRLGKARMRAYRLRARLLDQYEIVLFVSPVGEILRVELPSGIRLVNEAVGALQSGPP